MISIENSNGTITVSSEVFTMIAGDAATSCFGVKGMAGRVKEGGIYQLLRRDSMSRGVDVKFNDDNTASIGLHIIVENGVNLPAVCSSIKKEVYYKVTEATGMAVKNVDIFVDGMVIS